MRKAVIRAGLETLYYSGFHRLARQFLAGEGAILTFHRVRPVRAGAFQPNRHLEITPEFLDELIGRVREAGIDIVAMDEVPYRLMTRGHKRRFVALTFDDGYRDNLLYAWPVLKRHQAPFTVYVASAFADGAGQLWWMAVEAAIARSERIEVTLDGVERAFACGTSEAKCASFGELMRWIDACPDEATIRAAVGEIAFGYGVDMAKQCREACMDWEELSRMAGDPLTTIGAHTVNHVTLAKTPDATVRSEMTDGARRIRALLGTTPRHFAYPFGGPVEAGEREFAAAAAAGFATAVTTRPGVLRAQHAQALTALPRISINGEFQRLRYLDVLLSGAPTALINAFRRRAA
jgi:peptidoglycan/xylan/chitin deacetylase (PgdA/CDA1 family)